MGAHNTNSATAFMGDLDALALELAQRMLPELQRLASIDPPLSVKGLAEWTGWSESHIRQLVAHRSIPFHNRALPGSGRMEVFFWKHEISTWSGT